jgi:hypothetical protein
MIEEHGARLVYLPAYSLDLNPIEEAFSSIKAWLRANRDYVLGEVEGLGADPYGVIWEAVLLRLGRDIHPTWVMSTSV